VVTVQVFLVYFCFNLLYRKAFKPIQIQNSLAKSATCAACIDMDRSFLASSTGMLPMGGPTSSAALT
jgi:hypothetical protein